MFKSLQTKILLGFTLVIMLMGVLGSWAVITLSNIGKSNRETFQHKLDIVQELSSLDTAVVELRSATTRIIFSANDRKAYIRFEQSAKTASSSLEDLSQSVRSQPDQEQLYKKVYHIQHTATFLIAELRTQFASLKVGDSSGGSRAGPDQLVTSQIFSSEYDPIFDSLKAQVTVLERVYIKDLTQIAATGIERADTIRTEVFSFGIVVLLLCIAFSIRFANIIVNPITELTEKTRRISAGELNQIVIPRTNDEIGRLSEQFNAMAEKLGEFEELNLKKILEEKAISESIVQSMDDGLLLIDRFGIILSINRRAQEFFSVTNVEGKNCLDVARGIQALESLCMAALRGSWRDKDREVTVEHVLAREVIYLRRDIIPIQSGDTPGTVAFLLIFRDVTQQFEVEKMRSDFVGMVSHELRTPLTAIRMSVDLLAEPSLGDMTPVQGQFVQAIREESERLLRIVNDLMDLARLETGKFNVRTVPVDIQDFFDHLLLPFQATARDAEVTLEVEPNLSIKFIQADPDRLKQVFVNLVSNALRYTMAGGRISIGVRKGDAPGFAEFFVRDTGSGIPPDFLSKIFKRFSIISTDVKSGTGLGLAIVREIVQSHGGSIFVKSEVGVGTEFWFTLPLPSADGQLNGHTVEQTLRKAEATRPA
jgi:NtrC-family two-component system sensor histidine kinase KinB